jgi:hypothetical protein
MLGIFLGQLTPSGGDNSGWFDTRGLPRLMASLLFGFIGLIVGGFGGYRIAKRIDASYAATLAFITLAIPGFGYFVYSAKSKQEQAQAVVAVAQRGEEERKSIVRGNADREAYRKSPAYAEQVARETKMHDDFKDQIGTLQYPGSTYVAGDPAYLYNLEFDTTDNVTQIDEYFSHIPEVKMGYRAPHMGQDRYCYFRKGSFHGAITIFQVHGGAKLQYSLEPD